MPRFSRERTSLKANPRSLASASQLTINPAAKNFVRLMFHTGGKIPGDFPILEGAGDTCKYVRIEDSADLKNKRSALQNVIAAWCDWKTQAVVWTTASVIEAS